MANNTVDLHGNCMTPFFDETNFPTFPRSASARWCKDMPWSPTETLSCCLPCPAAQWRYSEGLEDIVNSVAWSAIPTLILVLFILASHIFLPVSATGRHFFTTSATIGFVIFQFAWIIPLNSEPDICRDEITAHDIRSDIRCGFSGGCLLGGVWVIILSCFCGAVYLHLTVCWEKTLGRKFKIVCLTLIFGGSAGLLAVVLTLTGVSYQFGKTCVVGPYMSKPTFWGPLLGVAAATLFIEFITVAYCIAMVTKPLIQDWRRGPKSVNSHSNSSFATGRMLTARAASNRVRRIVQLQWRAIAIVCLVLFHVALLGGVFIQVADLYDASADKLAGWLACLHMKESQEECVNLAAGSGPHQNFLLGSLILLILCPFWDFVVFIHRSMFLGWFDILRGRKPRDNGVRAGFLGGGGTGGSRKAIIERDPSRLSASLASPSPVDGMPLSVLSSQKIAGWNSPTPTSDRRYIASPSPTEERRYVSSPTPTVDRYGMSSPTSIAERNRRVPSSPTSISTAERQYRAPPQSFSAPVRPRLSDGDENEDGFYNNHSSYGTYTSVTYSPVSPGARR